MVTEEKGFFGEVEQRIERKPRVLFVIDHIEVGGVQEFICNYARNMDHCVTVAAVFRGDFYAERLRAAGANVIQITDSPYGHAAVLDPRNFLMFRRFIRDSLRDYDVVQIRLFAAFLYASLLRLYRYDHVYASIDATPDQIPAYILLIYRHYARRYRWFFLPPMYVAEFGFLRLNEKQILTRKYFVSRGAADEPHAFPSTFNFISVGRCIDQKGHAQALDFFRSLKAHFDGSSSLSIIGDGPGLEQLKSLAGSDPDIIFLGSVPGLSRYLKGCTAVLKFARGEGENSVVREAALAGRPVIATRETANCDQLAQQGLVIPVSRTFTPECARRVAGVVARFGDEQSAALRESAEQVWGESTIKAAWDTYPCL